MKTYFLKHLLFITFAVIAGISLYKYFFKSWSSYYQEKLYKEPRPLLLQALNFYNTFPDQEKKALDLGAGSGNDTAFLLHHGWHVWANDKEKEAIDIIASRKDVLPYQEKLTLIHASFTDIAWNDLPLFDLIYASYALPFLNKENFAQVWFNILDQLKPNGIIAIYLFGPHRKGFNWWECKNMSFFTKEEVLLLLRDFDIKVLEESCEKNDRGIMDHSFSIVAQKNK